MWLNHIPVHRTVRVHLSAFRSTTTKKCHSSSNWNQFYILRSTTKLINEKIKVFFFFFKSWTGRGEWMSGLCYKYFISKCSYLDRWRCNHNNPLNTSLSNECSIMESRAKDNILYGLIYGGVASFRFTRFSHSDLSAGTCWQWTSIKLGSSALRASLSNMQHWQEGEGRGGGGRVNW